MSILTIFALIALFLIVGVTVYVKLESRNLKGINLKSGEGKAALYFLRLAEADGQKVKRSFLEHAIKIRNENSGRSATHDDLVFAYNSARKDNGLEPIKFKIAGEAEPEIE